MPSPRRGFLLLIGLVVLAAAGKTILYDTLDPDCFWHLRVGEQLAREGIHPLRDTLSFASIREPWTPYSWLAELGMNKLWAAGRFRAAVLATALLVAGILTFITLATRELVRATQPDDDRYLATALLTAFATFLSLPYLSFRPVTLAFLFLAACAWLILRDRRLSERSWAVWAVVPITALVVNIHLFAALVPLWFAALFLGAMWEHFQRAPSIRATSHSELGRPRPGSERKKKAPARYAALCMLSALACTMTPMLPGMLVAIRHYTLRDPMVASTVIGEMQPFWHGGMGKVSLALVLIFATCSIPNRHRLRAGEMLWVLFGGMLLLWMGRMAPVFAMTAAPVFAVTMPKLSDTVLGRRALVGMLGAILVIAIVRVAIAFPSGAMDFGEWLNRNGPDAPGYPVAAANYIDSHLPRDHGRVINEFTWGGYLAWRLGPNYQVLLDGRTQLYAPEFWHASYLGGDDEMRRFISATRADVAVLPASKSRFREALVSEGWMVAYGDKRATVLVPGEIQNPKSKTRNKSE